MKKTLFLAAMAMFGFVCTSNAQEAEMPKYQRSSLHTVLLTTVEPTVEGAGDYTAYLDEAWQSYPFPAKYDQHSIALTTADGGAPKAGFFGLLEKFKGGFENLSLEDAKALLEQLKSPKAYQEELVKTVTELVANEKVGNQLMRKWWNIQDDGSYDFNLIRERAAYNATQTAIAEQEFSTRGVEAIFDQGEGLIANTFVTFSKLSMYNTEPLAAFIRDLMMYIGGMLPSPANIPFTVGANAAYNEMKDGQVAKTTTALYQLVWDEQVQADFYAMFTADNKIDMEKFNAYTFPMTLVGIDNASSNILAAKGRSADVIIKETLIRNMDKVFAKLQRNYEVFAPVSQIISVNPLVADMGTKEGLEGGEQFNLLEPVYNKATNKVEWKSVGVVKVDKKQIWNNEYSLTESGAVAEDTSEIKGTVLSNNKKAAVGMVVRQVVKGKKK